MKRLGIYAGVASSAPLEVRLAQIRLAGFDYVCLNFEKGMARTEGDWEEQLRLAQKYRLPVHAVHLTGNGMNAVWSEGAEGEVVVERLEEELRRLKGLGLSLGVAHITWGIAPPEKPSLIALRRFERIAETAEAYGVRLALENSAFSEPVQYVLDRIQSPFVGFCYDSGHEHAFTPETDFLSLYGDRLMEMHLHDNDGMADQHAVPFKGTIDWAEKMQKLCGTALGSRMLTLEAVLKPEKDLEEFLRDSYQAAIKLIHLKEE